MFPAWFAGVAFAAIGIGALVPAAIMSIAAANLFTRNIYQDFLRPDATPAQETKVSKLVSLLVKVGALVFVLTMDKTVAINFQLLGGIWILQTFPAARRRPVHPLVPPLGAARPAGPSAWSTARSRRTAWLSPTQKHFGGSLGRDPGHRRDRLHRAHRVRAQPHRDGGAHAVLRALKAPDGVRRDARATTSPTRATRGSSRCRS